MPDYKAIGAEIEALIETIPRRHVELPRVHVDDRPRAPRLEVPADLVPVEGAYPCSACGETVALPGICATCGERVARAELEAEMASAIASIPEAYAEASQARLLASVCRLEGGRSPWDRAGEIAIELAAREAMTVLVWSPTSGAAKSTFACAILRRVVAIALDALVAWRPRAPKTRLSPLPAEPSVISLGRGARVVSEMDLLTDAALGPEVKPGAYHLAEMAPLLVLDGLGGRRLRDVGASIKLIEERWTRHRPTIVTTHLSTSPQSADDIGKLYDGSVRRRLCDDRAARVVRVL